MLLASVYNDYRGWSNSFGDREIDDQNKDDGDIQVETIETLDADI